MSIDTTTHVNLRGDARAALEFYRSVFGGDLVAVTYADAHAAQRPEEADQIMWGQVTSPDGFRIMAYDVPSSRPWSRGDSPYFVSVRGADADEVSGYWKRLSADDRSTVVVDLAPSGWAPLYGMVTDPFGVTWVLDVAVTR
ncbi:VOC family protein [Actinoplanes italicus]|uniref:PhnB protein n=1 Tax=Actinoplanes italicus TaxID=113567 RepID=A0A2T0K5P1_9ACTN|nr:VOC family protein [Actinoplanes italicus]PRX18302.1 PhnB protein [Actinoplanes italicus]GIE32710.1 VOC family protein [Actinoplanes italicus]